MTIFSEIYQKQLVLIEHYQKLYGLPDYPLDVDNVENQETLRHLFSSLAEELIENAEKHLSIVSEVLSENKKALPKDIDELYSEIADCLHFYLEIFAFTNISEEAIRDFLVKNDLTKPVPEINEDIEVDENLEVLTEALRQGKIFIKYFVPKLQRGCFYTLLPQNIKLCGDSQLSSYLFYNPIHYLLIAQNTLKNKSWKKTQIPTDYEKLQKNLVLSFRSFLVYISSLNLTPDKVLEIYKTKNEINLERIRSKY